METDIVSIPSTDKWLGSCPNCGKSIWESYFYKDHALGCIYRCIECKYMVLKEAIIPF